MTSMHQAIQGMKLIFLSMQLYSGMRCQDVQMQKDQLIVETADMLKIPLFTAEALLKVHGKEIVINLESTNIFTWLE